MSIRNKAMLAVFLAPTLLAGAANAVEPGFYLGASGGQTTIDVNAKDYGFNGNDHFKIDDNDVGWKAYLGYNFVPWLGVEAGYIDLGGASKNFNGNHAHLDFTGWEGFLVGTLPLGPVDLFAKAGAIDIKSQLDTQNFGTSDQTNTKFAYGVGAAYNIGHWGLRVEAEGYDDNEVSDVYFLSAGVTYHFFNDKPAPVAAAPAPAPAACSDKDHDGVCDDVDQCPNTPPNTRVDSVGCSCDYTLSLQFAFNSSTLSPADKAKLDELAPVLTNLKTNTTIGGAVDGYTDSVGTDAYNLALSKRRAKAVVDYLESKGASLVGRFSVNGYGEANPVASNSTADGRAQNRRVVVHRTDCK
jgi:outer membrane protein OmpA-like peptidoglycan-associated protein